MFGGLRAALNEVFDTEENRSWPRAKLVDIAMVFVAGTPLVGIAFASTSRGIFSRLASLLFSTSLFYVIFKYLPSRRGYSRAGGRSSLFFPGGAGNTHR